jgi:hypothetical protein
MNWFAWCVLAWRLSITLGVGFTISAMHALTALSPVTLTATSKTGLRKLPTK